jgi:hypothetical protein
MIVIVIAIPSIVEPNITFLLLAILRNDILHVLVLALYRFEFFAVSHQLSYELGKCTHPTHPS